MPPKTRHSATASQDTSHAATFTVPLPADLSTETLTSLIGPADWATPTPEQILGLYRLVVSQKQDLDNWQETLGLKDAEIEQALHDAESLRIEASGQIEELKSQIESLQSSNQALEQDRTNLQTQLARLNGSSEASGVEVEHLRMTVQEREKEKKGLTDLLDAALQRETRLHNENTDLRAEVQSIRKQASESQARLASTSSSEATLQFKVSTLEQQITLLQQGNDKLNTDLSEQLTRHNELRRQKTEEISTLQSKLDRKSAEYDREAERARLLQASNTELERRLNETLERNRDLSSMEAQKSREFADEMAVAKDLLERYQKIADEAKLRVEDIEQEDEKIRSELAKREETLLIQVERERTRAEEAQKKVEELEDVLAGFQRGEFTMGDQSFSRARTPMSPGPGNVSMNAGNMSMGSLMLSPTASIVSKFQRGGKSITEVYAEYVRLQKELREAKQENMRLEVTLKDIYNEIQDRAPVLTQQRMEYDRISAEARQLAGQLSEAIEERDQQARIARETKHALQSKQKEVDLLNKQLADLSRQVRALSGRFETDPAPPSVLEDIDAQVSAHLVTFRSLPELIKKNHELLKLTRDLSMQLQERDTKSEEKEDEVMTEARMTIEALRAQLKTSDGKLDAYIQERDLLRKKVAQLQAGGAVVDPSGGMIVDTGEDWHRKYDEEHASLEVLRRETESSFATLRAELKAAHSQSTEAQMAYGKMRATAEYQNQRYEILQANYAQQTEELKTLSRRNNDLEVYMRQAEVKNAELATTLAQYSSNLAKAESEAQLLRSEKGLQKSREERLEGENRQLHAERARNQQTLEDYRRMKDELSALWEENKAALEKEKTRLSSELNALREEVITERTTTRTRLAEKESEARDLNHRLTQLNDELTKSRETAAVARASQTHLQTRADDLNKQLQRALEKLAVFERRPGTIELASANMGGSEEENLRAQVAELSAELKTVQLELTTEKANGEYYQGLAQTAENALTEYKISTDESLTKAQQGLAARDMQITSLQEKINALSAEVQTLSEQRTALEAEMEAKEVHFQQEKAILEGIVADVNGADKRAIEAQEATHQELLAEAQKTREAQQKYQAMLIDHAAVLKERDTLQQQLQEAQLSANRHHEEAKTAQSILVSSQKSWELQAESLKQEVVDMQSRYDSLSKQNDILHKQLASVTSQAVRLGDLSDTAMAAITDSSSDVQIQELQQVIQHIKREGDLLRGQQELLKRENARLTGDVRRLTSELEFTRQRLAEERELASKASAGAGSQEELLAKISENAALVETNRILRNEKAHLEERLSKKSDELIATQSEISPLKQEVHTLRSERDYMKVENETLQNSIDQWRKRATSIATKLERIDPEVHEQLKTEKEQLEGQVESLKTQITKVTEQMQRWKSAQQQWKNAHDSVMEQSKELQSQLALANAQNEATAKELESVKAAAGSADSSALSNEIAQLREQLTALQAENVSLKEELSTLQSSASTTAPTAEVETLQQQLKQTQAQNERFKSHGQTMIKDIKALREKVGNLEKELAQKSEMSAPADVEAIVAQRVEVAVTQAKTEQEIAVATAIAPLQEQIKVLSEGQPDLAQLQERHAAELQALQQQLAAATSAGVPDDIIEARVGERIAELQVEHAAALAKATESGRMEAEMKLKMLQAQFNRARNELNQLKAAQSGTAAPAPAGVATTSATGQPQSAFTANPAAVSASATTPGAVTASPTATRGRGRGIPAGRGVPIRGRGAAAAPGLGRGSVLDTVNQVIAGGSASAASPGQISILGASGQKRTREDEEMADAGSLAKRLKPGDAGLPPKPAGRGTSLNRGRVGTPPAGPS